MNKMEWTEEVNELQKQAGIALDEVITALESALKSAKIARTRMWQSWDMEWTEEVNELQKQAGVALDEVITALESALKSAKIARTRMWQSWDEAKKHGDASATPRK